jgi:hypothetical protein
MNFLENTTEDRSQDYREKDVSLAIITPIYKPKFDEIEQKSISFSISLMPNYDHIFFGPVNLDLSYYKTNYPDSQFATFSDNYFKSHSAYNQLCYETKFYASFERYNHILILQPDSIILNPSEILNWSRSCYDYVGAPEGNLYTYNINGIPPFNSQTNLIKTVSLQGLNGGFSLRRVSKVISALEEYPELVRTFRTYANGIGEDIFFSLMSRITQKGFYTPNEVQASKFALTNNFSSWIEFNKGQLPAGLHRWSEDEFVRGLMHGRLFTNG